MTKLFSASIKSRTLSRSLVVFFIFSFFFVACASNGRYLPEVDQLIGNSQLVWPGPPADAKIRFIRSVRSSRDIGTRSNWFTNVIRSISGEEDNVEQMARPYGVYAHGDRLYVADPGLSLVHFFDFSERRYIQIRSAKDRALESPVGVAVDGDGQIFITDSVLRRVFTFNKYGKYTGEIASSDLFERPTGIALHNDRIYVVDTQGHRVKVFSHDSGRLLFQFGKNGLKNGEFHYPTHIFASADGHLYITDSLNFRVQIFDCDGNFLSVFGRLGDALGDFSKPKGIATDSDGNIYVADSQFDNVQIFDQSGRLLLIFGGSGSEKGRMSLPAGVFIDTNDRIYVADSYNRRIQVFQYLGKHSKQLD
jgi:DNA-binding beta-propeller fold protein YncE